MIEDTLARYAPTLPADADALERAHAEVRRGMTATAPPARRRAPRWALAAAVALVIGIVTVVATRPEAALAGWTPTPREVTGSELQALATECWVESDFRYGFEQDPNWVPPYDDLSQVRPLAAEARGPWQLVAVGYGERGAVCLAPVGEPFGVINRFATWRNLNADPVAVLERGGVGVGTAYANVVVVRLAPGITTAQVHTADGRVLEATVSGEFAIAFWPAPESDWDRRWTVIGIRTGPDSVDLVETSE